MTDAVIYRGQAGMLGFEIVGHAGFAEAGEDIVCAAISAISQTAILGLTEVLKLEVDCTIDDERGRLRAMLPKGAPQGAQIILGTMVEGLVSIHRQYPDCIRIRFQERR